MLRKDLPRLIGLFGFFFLMGGYGNTAEWIVGDSTRAIYAVSSIAADAMLTAGVYFVVLMGRKMLKKYYAMQEGHISSLSKKLAT